MGTPTVASVETFAMEHLLGDQEYGCAKFLAPSRASTLVKVTTTDGVHGWGEAFGPIRLVAPALAAQARGLIGKPVSQRENRILEPLSKSYHLTSGGPHVFAMSGIDTALWDAFARTLDVPVFELFGGGVRDSIEAYASTGYVTRTGGVGQFRQELESAVADGFNAAKIRIGVSPRDDYDRVKLAREILGPDRKLMVDYNTSGNLASIRKSLSLINEFDLFWVEEPLPPEDVKGWEALRSTGHNLTGGESLCTRYAFKNLVVNKRMDIIQPDLAAGGGLTEGQAILTMANTWHVGISPHCWGTGILQAATLQLLAAASPSTGHPHIFEFDQGYNPQREGVLKDPIRQNNGVVLIPTSPGLGVDVDEDWVSRNAVEGLGIKASL